MLSQDGGDNNRRSARRAVLSGLAVGASMSISDFQKLPFDPAVEALTKSEPFPLSCGSGNRQEGSA
jgi:hypothetical protein